jgi:amino acid transporter
MMVNIVQLTLGWGNLNYSLSELKDPLRNFPKASFASNIMTCILYMGATFAYFIVVPICNHQNNLR